MNIIDSVLYKEISAINCHLERILHSDNDSMQEIIDWILQSRGKQLRPKLLCLCSKFGKTHSDTTKLAAMLEIIHTASLVHDDIIDDSETRRGYLSVQKKFGKHMAVYAGDYMIFCVVKAAINDTNYKKYANLYNVVQKMCYGELSQYANLYQTSVTEEAYINNITGKTAVLFQTACELGAMETKASAKIIHGLGKYGKSLGLLFQIRDDLFDYVSTENKLGKPILQDFANGIYTLPIIYSFENPKYKTELLEIAEHMKHHGLCSETANQVLDIIYHSGSIEKTHTKAKEIYTTASSELSLLPNIKEKYYLEHILEKIYNNIEQIGG